MASASSHGWRPGSSCAARASTRCLCPTGPGGARRARSSRPSAACGSGARSCAAGSGEAEGAIRGRAGAWEAAVVVAAGVVLAVAATWPLTLELRSRLPDDLQAPSLPAWQLAWAGHALIHQPLHLFQANAFWPLSHSLAFTDPLIGYAPAGLIGSGPGAAVVRYNLLYLFSYALAFAASWFLARELGLRPLGAAVTAAAFAFAPWRASQAGHLHILSSGGIPLT